MKKIIQPHQNPHLCFGDIAFLVGIIVYCILAFALPIYGIISAINLILLSSEVATILVNPVGIGLLCTAVNIMVGGSLCAYPIANLVVSGQLNSLPEYNQEQQKKFDGSLNVSLITLMCFMVIAIILAIYGLTNIVALPLTAGVIFIVLQAIGLLIFILGAISAIFFD